MPSNHLILCRPLLLPPSIFPNIRAFSNESVLRIRWPRYWSFSFNISPSNEHPGLISFRTDWLDLLAVQGTLKSLLQHHGSKASIRQCPAFFTVQLSHPYMATGKTKALTLICLLFLAVWGLPCCPWAFSSFGEWGPLSVAPWWLPSLQFHGSRAQAPRLWYLGLAAPWQVDSFRIGQGLNSCPLHWQAVS